jgi:tetratricopeptide (TPR) repeat protein
MLCSREMTEVTSLDSILTKKRWRGYPTACRWSYLLRPVILAFFFAALLSAQTPNPSEAQALERDGKFAEAATVWRAITQRDPQNAAAWASLGLALSRMQQYLEGAAAYRKAIALDPKMSGVQLNLGLAEFKQGHLQAAIQPLQAALAADPQNMQARTLLGLSCYGVGRFEEATEQLAAASKSDFSNAELHRVLAQSCLSAKKYSCALDEFSWIQRQNPDSPAVHVLTGEALDGLGRTPEAIAEFELAAKSDRQAPSVHFGLGYLYWKMRQYDEAKRAFETELSIDPSNSQALAYLGDIELKNGDQEKALTHLRNAARLRDDISIAHLDMGVIFTEQKQYQDALAALQRAEKLDPQQPEIHYRLGRLHQSMGNAGAAKSEFAKVQSLHKKEEENIADKMSGQGSPTPR